MLCILCHACDVSRVWRAPRKKRIWIFGKAVSYGGLFFSRLQSFFCFQVTYCPVKRGNRADSSRNESDYSRRALPRSVFRFLRVAVARIRTSSFFNCVVRKLTVDQNGALCLNQLFFLARKLKNELVRNSRNREAGKWPGYLSESSQTPSDESRLDFLSLRGNN